MKLKINKKLINQLTAGILAGTMIISLTGCKNLDRKGKNQIADDEKLQDYLYGYYLEDSDLAQYYVIKTDDSKLRIVDIDNKSVYSSREYGPEDSIHDDLYKYMDENLIKSESTYTESDIINLEKYINGEDNYEILPKNTQLENKNIIEPNKWYYYEDFAYHADAQYIEIIFVDDKAERICRRIIEDSGSTSTGNILIDIIDGRKITPTYKGIIHRKETNTVNNFYEGKNVECVQITDLLDDASKNTLTSDEILEIYYSIAGKSKEEVKEIINNIFFPTKGKELILTPTEHK